MVLDLAETQKDGDFSAQAEEANVSEGYSVSTAEDGEKLRWVYALIFVWALFILIIDEIVKAHERKLQTAYQKRSRQHFETVLGMHSPK